MSSKDKAMTKPLEACPSMQVNENDRNTSEVQESFSVLITCQDNDAGRGIAQSLVGFACTEQLPSNCTSWN